MTCDDALPLISALLDGELDGDSRAALEVHLESCAACRAVAESQRSLDADLRRAFTHSEAATRVANRVIERLPVTSAKPSSFGLVQFWLAIAAATAAGFAIALVCFPPGRSGQPIVESPPADPGKAAPTSLARLVVSTGEIQVRPTQDDAWQAVPQPEAVQLPAGGAVRTAAGVSCELQTSTGAAIRLNEHTELAIRNETEVELRSGQLWCRSPAKTALHVVSASVPPKPDANLWSFVCPSDGQCVTEVTRAGAVRITSASGEVDVSIDDERRRLKQGETAQIADGRIEVATDFGEGLLSTSWMHPLLVRKGHDNPELDQRVNAILAYVGQSKITYLLEDEIRSLGEHGVLPLLRFVQSSQSREDANRRKAAMRILADVAPAWAIPDLIELLADEDAEVRTLAATALQRLTRHTQGRAPQEWTSPGPEFAESYEAWQAWWQANRHRYASPVPRDSGREFPAPTWLKARGRYAPPPASKG